MLSKLLLPPRFVHKVSGFGAKEPIAFVRADGWIGRLSRACRQISLVGGRSGGLPVLRLEGLKVEVEVIDSRDLKERQMQVMNEVVGIVALKFARFRVDVFLQFFPLRFE